MKVSVGSDHAGFECKQAVIAFLELKGILVTDHGCYSTDSVDYPDFVHPVGNDIDLKQADFGIVLCGSGNGVAMTVNKHKAVRCALCWNEEIAQLARAHNNANVLSIPARYVTLEIACNMVGVFIDTAFESGRHQRRIDKINLP